MKKYIFCLLPLALLLSACTSPTADLTGEWRLVKLNGADPLPGTNLTLVFDGEKVSGSGGCNSYFGEYSVKGDKITFKDLGMTLMACLDAQANQQETDYFNALGQVEFYQVTQDSLTLTGQNVTLEFTKENLK